MLIAMLISKVHSLANAGIEKLSVLTCAAINSLPVAFKIAAKCLIFLAKFFILEILPKYRPQLFLFLSIDNFVDLPHVVIVP